MSQFLNTKSFVCWMQNWIDWTKSGASVSQCAEKLKLNPCGNSVLHSIKSMEFWIKLFIICYQQVLKRHVTFNLIKVQTWTLNKMWHLVEMPNLFAIYRNIKWNERLFQIDEKHDKNHVTFRTIHTVHILFEWFHSFQ